MKYGEDIRKRETKGKRLLRNMLQKASRDETPVLRF